MAVVVALVGNAVIAVPVGVAVYVLVARAVGVGELDTVLRFRRRDT
jgi:hypothetical protein